MIYDLKALDHKKNLFTTYPELERVYKDCMEICSVAELPTEHEPLTKEELMMLITYSYHLHSPIIKEISIHKRRQIALGMIGYELKTEKDFKDNPELFSFIIGKNEFVNRLALVFCKYENSYDWLEICRISELIDDSFLLLKEEAASKGSKSATEIQIKKFEMDKIADPYRQKIRQLSQNLFQNDNDLISFAASTLLLEKRKRLLVPEDIASLTKDELQSAFAD